MKRIVLLYAFALIVCISIGLIISLISCYSWLYAILFSFIVSFGWIPFTLIIESITKNYSRNVRWFLTIALIIQIVLITIVITSSELNLFWEMTSLISTIMAIITTIALIVRIRNIE